MITSRILVAEDDPGVRLSLELLLGVEGYEVLSANDGEAAAAIALEALPDAILLDHMMPRMSGRRVLELLRSDPTTSSIPVLVLTGMGRESSEDWPDATFVGKPFRPEHLLKELEKALHRAREGSAARA